MGSRMSHPHSRLCLIGGAADQCLAQLVQFIQVISSHPSASRHKRRPTVVVSHASGTPRQVGDDVCAELKKLGLDNVSLLTPRTRALPPDAGAVYMTGGDQSRLVRLLDACGHRPWLDRQIKSGALICGTSAGAAACATTMVAGGMSDGVLKQDSLLLSQGLGYLRGVIIDTHFSQRNRQVRMQAAVTELPGTLAIGLDEDTGILVEGGRCTVFGQGRVWTFRRSLKKNTHVRDHRLWLEIASTPVVTGYASGEIFKLSALR